MCGESISTKPVGETWKENRITNFYNVKILLSQLSIQSDLFCWWWWCAEYKYTTSLSTKCLGPLHLWQCVIETLSVTQDVITSPIREMKRDAVAGRYMSPLFCLLNHSSSFFSKHFFFFPPGLLNVEYLIHVIMTWYLNAFQVFPIFNHSIFGEGKSADGQMDRQIDRQIEFPI